MGITYAVPGLGRGHDPGKRPWARMITAVGTRSARPSSRNARSGRASIESLAYHGTKYKTAEYVPIMHRTEIGIYETYVMCDRTLTDDEVEADLERLIVQMRRNSLPPPAEKGNLTLTDDNKERLLIWNIRRNWRIMAEDGVLVPKEDLIGVLRTILHSLETWRSKSLHSQGYLHFLEGFMKQTGVSVGAGEAGPASSPLPGAPNRCRHRENVPGVDHARSQPRSVTTNGPWALRAPSKSGEAQRAKLRRPARRRGGWPPGPGPKRRGVPRAASCCSAGTAPIASWRTEDECPPANRRLDGKPGSVSFAVEMRPACDSVSDSSGWACLIKKRGRDGPLVMERASHPKP